jgi:hypothetical protein
MPDSPGLNGKAGCGPENLDATNWTSTAASSARTSLRFQPASSPAGWKTVRSACRKPSPEQTYRNQPPSLSSSAPSCSPAFTSCGSGRHAHRRHRCAISASRSRCWKKLRPISTCAPSPAKTSRTSNADWRSQMLTWLDHLCRQSASLDVLDLVGVKNLPRNQGLPRFWTGRPPHPGRPSQSRGAVDCQDSPGDLVHDQQDP